ncbi:putative 3 5 -cyclic nucleotide phosphodiesterase [Erysiphe neolycopersici]|uniref:Phosphodiesterase n=1 Tax=Erysiphe neolycopersici TaxID=212602 RepID=A0A420HBS5_9PEZI|nr:putative 3 5 -cyclic nucleotide phosphodiesterase [Erysiphe neolycopersici]
MNYTACSVLYVNRTANYDELVRQDMDISVILESMTLLPSSPTSLSCPSPNPALLRHNVEKLMQVFNEVYICASGKSCISKLFELSRGSIIDLVPIIVLIDVPNEDQPNDKVRNEKCEAKLNSTVETPRIKEEEEEDKYGLELLQYIASEIEHQSLSSLIVPVAMVEAPNLDTYITRSNSLISLQPPHIISPRGPLDQRDLSPSSNYQLHTVRSFDTGAVDVLISPIAEERLSSLLTHAYRAHYNALKEHRALIERRRNRKRSWVGVDVNDQKPYAHLREVMVSRLMDGICQIGDHTPPPKRLKILIAPNRKEAVNAVVASWNFSAHEFTDDELLHAALVMLQHTLTMPELEPWRISTENLTEFLLASRSAYNDFVPYHNFRHVIDVLQACFVFLIRLGRIPTYPGSEIEVSPYPSTLAETIRPYDALTLLITAIGHDVGHPGVNNAFLTSLNAPLAQLYNDRSVLESFHCAAYSQILRCHWPSAFRSAEMRQLIISTILATDMGLHFEYMKKLARVKESLLSTDKSVENPTQWSSGEQRTLACSLLIKCADISNVARKFNVTSAWTMILTDEFSRQAAMEEEMGIPSLLFAPPVREITTLGKSQIGFIETFAYPLFDGVAEVMPSMSFCVEELQRNKTIWNEKILKQQNSTPDENSVEKEKLLCTSKVKEGRLSYAGLQCLTVPNEPKSKIRPYLQPLDVSLSTTNFQNISPFSNKYTSAKSSEHCSSRDFSRPNSPLSRPSSFKQGSNSAQCESPLSMNITDFDLNSDHIERSKESPLSTEENLTQELGLKLLQLEGGLCSNETECSFSLAGDWNSEAILEIQPPSPSTQVSSIASFSENLPDITSHVRIQRSDSTIDRDVIDETEFCNDNTAVRKDDVDQYLKGVVVLQKVRVVKKKKSSRFRMSFWKRNKRNNSLPILIQNHNGEKYFETH